MATSLRIFDWRWFLDFPLSQRSFCLFDIDPQSAGLFGFEIRRVSCGTVASSAAAWCGSKPLPIGGMGGVEVGRSVGLGVAWPWIGGSLVGGGRARWKRKIENR